MKVLLIIRDIDKSALGIVGNSLIRELSQIVELDVLFSNGNEISIDNNLVKNFYRIKYPNIPIRLYWGSMKILNCNLFDEIWAKLAALKIKKNNYDIVFDIVSIMTLDSLLLGNIISQRDNIKHAVYFVDAIPAKGWSYHNKLNNTLKSIVSRVLPSADYFASCNEQMLKYQLSTFLPKKKLKSSVIYLPTYADLCRYTESSNFNFLYTGKIYANRSIENMLKAFEKFHKKYPESNFIFVGTNLSKSQLAFITPSIKDNVKIFEFTTDLSHFYKDATVLVDIDAQLDNDVFLSSKVIKYLSINRIILCETGKNSPSRKLFNGIDSIIQCGHDVEELYEGMLSCIQKNNNIDFSDRTSVLELFDAKKIAFKVKKDFSEII